MTVGERDETARWLERIIHRGLSALRDAYEVYWPASGNTDAKERNLTLYAAHALRDEGFLTFCEANFPGQTEQRLDLLALHEEREILVLGESKRCYSTEKLEEMVEDVSRIVSFPCKEMRDVVVSATYGVLLASTANKEYADWWVRGTEPPAGVRRQAPWVELYARLGDKPTRWSSVDLGHEYYGLLVVFPMSHVEGRV